MISSFRCAQVVCYMHGAHQAYCNHRKYYQLPPVKAIQFISMIAVRILLKI